MLSRGEGCQGLTSRHGEHLCYGAARCPYGPSVTRSCGDHDKDVIEATIADLEQDAARLRLEVVDPRLGFGRK
jgi:hypothetical protein